MALKRISIIGVGLLGGSIGLSLRAAGSPCVITGYGHRQETLDKAIEFGVIDHGTSNLTQAVHGADLVVLCTPVGLFRSLLQQMSPALKAGAVVTDVGSTKRSVVTAATELLPANVSFVGSHPMAGSEKRGVEYARADLFQNALCIVTPTCQTRPGKTKAVEQFWKTLGMRTVRLSPEEHDAAVSDISHLPHVLAAALVLMQSREAMPLAGKGFLDTTRVASGDAVMWRDILLDNQDNVKASLKRLEGELANLRKLLTRSRSEALIGWLTSAARRRDNLLQQKLKEIAGE